MSCAQVSCNELLRAIELVETNHELLAQQTQTLNGALEQLRRGGQAGKLLAVFDALRQYFVCDFLPQLEQEQREFFPLIEAHLPGGVHHAGRLRIEHQALREQVEGFRAELSLVRFVNDATAEAIGWGLLAVGRQLWLRLCAHTRNENRLLARLKAAVSEAEGVMVGSGRLG